MTIYQPGLTKPARRSFFLRLMRAATFGLVLAALLLPTTATDADAAFAPNELTCREALSKTGSKLGQTAAKVFSGCHKKRGRGQIDSATDCNSVAGADDKDKIAKAGAKVLGQAASKCGGLVPVDLLYQSCPSPCDATVPALNDMNDVAACVECVVTAAAQNVSGEIQGSPTPPLSTDDRKCHETLGKNYNKILKTILKERAKCQKTAEAGGAMDTTSCAMSDPKGKIAKAIDKSDDKNTQQCAAANLNNVPACSLTSLPAINLCVNTTTETAGETMFQSFYNLMAGSTGTTTTTTTMGGGSTTTTTLGNTQDPQCPDLGELTIIPQITSETCTTNGDCTVGTCDSGLGRCRTATQLDTGWTGISHGADVNETTTVANLLCPGPAPTCGQCTVDGLTPQGDLCRCANDNRAICDEPFQSDADDCGGDTCNCYFGGPLPLSAGNTPACVVNRFAQDVSGTVNVDTGLGQISTNLRSVVYLGQNLFTPCPYCSGDTTPNDGVRDGLCVFGENAGETCDVQSVNESFPAPVVAGNGHSLDCFPDVGKNVSGAGLKIDITQTTGTADSISVGLECGFPPFVVYDCHCGICSGDPAKTTSCTTNTDCSTLGLGDCVTNGNGAPLPNQCSDVNDCVDMGGGQGVCSSGPTDRFCDGIVRSNGNGFIGCLANADCDAGTIGTDAGDCTLASDRPCFGDTITAQGTPDPSQPIGAATFCVPPTSNGGINTVAGLPGPGKVINQGQSRTFCASNQAIQYTPGVGGCP